MSANEYIDRAFVLIAELNERRKNIPNWETRSNIFITMGAVKNALDDYNTPNFEHSRGVAADKVSALYQKIRIPTFRTRLDRLVAILYSL